jgi:hypothetical protein
MHLSFRVLSECGFSVALLRTILIVPSVLLHLAQWSLTLFPILVLIYRALNGLNPSAPLAAQLPHLE